MAEHLSPEALRWAQDQLETLVRRQAVSQHPSVLNLARVVLALGAEGNVVLIGRGVFCGWLCPFGALQELLAEAARALRVPQWNPPAALEKRLWLGKYIATYWVIDGRYEDHMRWTVATNQRLLADGRVYLERDHIFTAFQRYLTTFYRDEDGPRDIHAFEYPYQGLVVEVIDAPEGGSTDEGRTFFVPYEEVSYVRVEQVLKLGELKRMYGETGFVVRPNDPGELAAAVEHLLGDEGDWRSMAEAAATAGLARKISADRAPMRPTKLRLVVETHFSYSPSTPMWPPMHGPQVEVETAQALPAAAAPRAAAPIIMTQPCRRAMRSWRSACGCATRLRSTPWCIWARTARSNGCPARPWR